MVRIINVSAIAAFLVTFDQHEMTIIEVDGVYTKAQKTNLISLSAGQRMSVLIHTKSDTSKNFAFVGAMDPAMFDSRPPSLDLNATGYLVYDDTKPLPLEAPTFTSYDAAFDDFGLVPNDNLALLEPVNHQIVFNVNSGHYFNQNRCVYESRPNLPKHPLTHSCPDTLSTTSPTWSPKYPPYIQP
jgi:iron transport multicopper oxidase